MDLEIILDKLIDFATVYGIKIIGAILVWIIGSWPVSYTHLTLPTITE